MCAYGRYYYCWRVCTCLCTYYCSLPPLSLCSHPCPCSCPMPMSIAHSHSHLLTLSTRVDARQFTPSASLRPLPIAHCFLPRRQQQQKQRLTTRQLCRSSLLPVPAVFSRLWLVAPDHDKRSRGAESVSLFLSCATTAPAPSEPLYIR